MGKLSACSDPTQAPLAGPPESSGVPTQERLGRRSPSVENQRPALWWRKKDQNPDAMESMFTLKTGSF